MKKILNWFKPYHLLLMDEKYPIEAIIGTTRFNRPYYIRKVKIWDLKTHTYKTINLLLKTKQIKHKIIEVEVVINVSMI